MKGKAGIAFAAGIAVPGWANAHGEEALIVGLLLPSAVVPAVLLVWLLATAVLGVRVRSRSRTALAVFGAAVAGSDGYSGSRLTGRLRSFVSRWDPHTAT